ncbi:MAG: hypothetical protein QGG14_03100 [Planctomycetota bacterium]|jgi:hypothetical protein|nr:hypothetical protein [Planctomycetota bacterium]
MAMRAETIEIGIYGLALGLFGLLGYEFYRKTMEKPEGPRDGSAWKKLRKDLKDVGEKNHGDGLAWRYGAKELPWWERIQHANWTGKLPPKPIDVVTHKESDEPPPPVVTPIAELVELLAILANGTDVARIQIRYKDANVQVPSTTDTTASGTGGAAVGAGPMDVTPNAGGGMNSAVGAPFHSLVAGDTLFPPYQAIRFVGVDLNGPAALFERPDPDPAKKALIKERLARNELALSEDHVVAADIAKLGGRRRASSKSSKERAWVKPPGDETTVMNDVWMISKRDNQRIQIDYNRILTEDIVIEDYRGRKDRKTGERLKGVTVSNVSRTAARFGVKKGDILIAVNGQRVTGKANAINTGKKQYNRGIRTFDLKFLTSGGREVIRTYRAPDK